MSDYGSVLEQLVARDTAALTAFMDENVKRALDREMPGWTMDDLKGGRVGKRKYKGRAEIFVDGLLVLTVTPVIGEYPVADGMAACKWVAQHYAQGVTLS